MHFNDPLQNPPHTDWVRLWDCGVTWKDIHLGPDKYDWSRLDYLVNLYSDRKILYVICATPRWLAKDPNAPHYAPWLGPGTNSLPHNIEEWNKFVWNLATRYKGRIHAYEIWNEPQLADFMYPYTIPNINLLANMTKRAYSTIKSIDKSAFVVSASVLPRLSSGGMKRAAKYLRALRLRKWPVDRVSCHIYPEVGKGAKAWAAYLLDVQSSVKHFGGPPLIWVTETNYNLLGPVINDGEAEKLIKDTYLYAGKHPIFWYGWDKTDVLGGLNIKQGTQTWAAIQKYS